MKIVARVLFISMAVLAFSPLSGCSDQAKTVQPANAVQQPTTDAPPVGEEEPTLPDEGP